MCLSPRRIKPVTAADHPRVSILDRVEDIATLVPSIGLDPPVAGTNGADL